MRPLRSALAAALLGAAQLLSALPATAAGDNVAPAPLTVDPARQHYAFDEPAILVRQIIFGLAHGVTLLARACLDAGEELRPPTQRVYQEWLARHGERIIDAEQALARHYFGDRAGEVAEEDLARALKLPPQLDPLPTPERLHEACASFPEALARPRYDLDRVFASHRDEQRLARAVEVRAAVAQCREIAAAETLPAIDAALAAWAAANATIEAGARQRWLEHSGDAEELRRWENSVAQAIRNRLLGGKVDSDGACRQMIADLPKPENALLGVMPEGAAPAAASTAR